MVLSGSNHLYRVRPGQQARSRCRKGQGEGKTSTMGVRTPARNEVPSRSRITSEYLCQLSSCILQVRLYNKRASIRLHFAPSNLFILLYRSAFVADEEGPAGEEGQIALQAAQRITSIAEDLLSEDLVRYANTHL